eukprot:jgi/Tetstr1/440076/TSEL_028435.t1
MNLVQAEASPKANRERKPAAPNANPKPNAKSGPKPAAPKANPKPEEPAPEAEAHVALAKLNEKMNLIQAEANPKANRDERKPAAPNANPKPNAKSGPKPAAPKANPKPEEPAPEAEAHVALAKLNEKMNLIQAEANPKANRDERKPAAPKANPKSKQAAEPPNKGAR